MQEKSCRCGVSKKRFKYDIGPFYVGECCKEAGFDDLGHKPGEETEIKIDVPSQESPTLIQSLFGIRPKAATVVAPSQVLTPPKVAGRGKLMDMRVEDLKTMAKSKGIAGHESMTKKQLVAAILT